MRISHASIPAALLLLSIGALSSSASATHDDRHDLTTEEAALVEYQEKFLDPQAPEVTEHDHTDHAHPSKEHHRLMRIEGNAVTGPLPAATGGEWSYGKPLPADFNAIHTITGPNGKVLIVAGSGNLAGNLEAGSFRTFLLDSKTDQRREIFTPADLFCAGHTLLPDGRALLAGGNAAYAPFKGLRDLYAFDFTQERYEKITDMEVGRWYPSAVADRNGNTLISGGLDENGRNTPVVEHYNWRTNTLRTLPGARQFPLYPRHHFAKNGTYFHAGGRPWSPPGFWNPFVRNNFKPVAGHTNAGDRIGSASCFVGDVRDQRVMIMGGGWPATASTNIIDLDSAVPRYVPGPDLPAAKGYVNCVNLPNGQLFQTHGGTANRSASASRETSVLSGDRSRWLPMNPLPDGEHRLYHGTATLLDDGSVVSLGSNPNGGDPWSTSLLVYRPSYFFEGARPTITRAPTAIRYGRTYRIGAETPGSTLRRVTLVTASAPTHATDPNQRYMSLRVRNGRFTLPRGRTTLPVGMYRLFAVDRRGVPSEARWVMVR